jgi:hypothetical protein
LIRASNVKIAVVTQSTINKISEKLLFGSIKGFVIASYMEESRIIDIMNLSKY